MLPQKRPSSINYISKGINVGTRDNDVASDFSQLSFLATVIVLGQSKVVRSGKEGRRGSRVARSVLRPQELQAHCMQVSHCDMMRG